jgi:hypothetical protein
MISIPLQMVTTLKSLILNQRKTALLLTQKQIP